MLVRESIYGIALAALVIAPAAAQSANQEDLRYLRQSLQTNNAEIATANEALQKSTNYGVRQMALLMIHDHTVMNRQMRPTADSLGVHITDGQMTAPQRQLADQLRALDGDAFDRSYIAAMVRGHEEALNETRKEAAQSQFPALKDAAQKLTYVIQQHLEMAQNLAQQNHVPVSAP
jgi:putative membrane protein